MDRAKRRLVSALDGFRSTQKLEMELDEKISADDVQLNRIVRHGFPDDPRCIAYDPVQRLLAVGTGSGSVRILGDIGVDYHLKHASDAAVSHLQFLFNEGALVTACRDDLVHLWNLRQKVPEILHSMQLSKESVTCLSHPFQNKWLYFGTDRGNVYFVSIASFTLSNYAINWNKAIDLSCRTHPGAVKALLTCPTEPCKLLILFEKGAVAIWNLNTKEVDRYTSEHALRCVAWHHDGRQFISGAADGSLIIWNARKSNECVQRLQPHGRKCKPITQIDWRHSTDGEQLIIFSGGISQEEGAVPTLTIMYGSKSESVLELDHPLIAFEPLLPSAYPNAPQHPFGLAVLMKKDLIVVDLTSPNYPCYENLNPMDIHESPIKCILYFSDCPLDLLGALTLVGAKQRRQCFSEKPWPITGGSGRECALGHQELLLTGHEDGSIKFWQASGEHLQILYKLKTGRHFERNGEESCEISHGAQIIDLCMDSRLLLVAGRSGQISLFRFSKTESTNEITVVNVSFSLKSENEETPTSVADCATPVKDLRHQSNALSRETHSTDTSEGSSRECIYPLKVRGGALRRPAGYQPELVCLIPWRSTSQPECITSIKLSSAYGLIAIGTQIGLAIVDLVQCTLIHSWTSAELYAKQPSTSISLSQNCDTPAHESRQDLRRNVEQSSSVRAAPRLGPEARRQLLIKTHSVMDRAHDHINESFAKGGSLDSSPSSADKFPIMDNITSLSFIKSYSKKGDSRAHFCLWVGTSGGVCMALNLLFPADRLSNVIVAPSGSLLHTRGRILYATFMDHNFCVISAATESYRDKDNDGKPSSSSSGQQHLQNKVLTKISLSPTCSNASDLSKEDNFLQACMIVVASEDEVHVVALPNFVQMFSHRTEIPFVKANVSHIQGRPVLILLNGAGQIVVLSLPTLRVLNSFPLLRHSIDIDDPICFRTSFNDHGLGMYTVTPSEVQKFTVSSELATHVHDAAGDIFVPMDMPEAPKSSFLKGVSTLFAGQKESIDLDTIFSEKAPGTQSSGGMRSIAKTIPGMSVSIDQVTGRSVTAGQAATMAMQALSERGEKLGSVVDASERLKDDAMTFSQRTGKLVEKFEKKKWYNF